MQQAGGYSSENRRSAPHGSAAHHYPRIPRPEAMDEAIGLRSVIGVGVHFLVERLCR
jgi:hypothetical protein